MTLRKKLLLAQLPLVLAVIVLGVVAIFANNSLAHRADDILHANYRSARAMQRIKESVERIDSSLLFMLVGHSDIARIQIEAHRPIVEEELLVEEGNITEPGEHEAALSLRASWIEYQQQITSFSSQPNTEQYFQKITPLFLSLKDQADLILQLNQDAMIRKSNTAQQTARRLNTLMISVALLSLLSGLALSSTLTSRMLRPLATLHQITKRIGEGDYDVKADTQGEDELAQLSVDFNLMAERLRAYKRSSIGELLQAQHASQAAIESLPEPVVVYDLSGKILATNQAAAILLSSVTPVRSEAKTAGWYGTPAISVQMDTAVSSQTPRTGMTDTCTTSVSPVQAEGADSGVHLHVPQMDTAVSSQTPRTGMTETIDTILETVAAHVLQGKGPYTPKGFEEALRVDGPEPRFFLPRANPIYGEDRALLGVTVLLQDVTRLRHFDELKNDLVATVAHEFRTPLTSLRMAIHLCLEEVVGPLTEKQSELLHASREDTERLQSLVDELLDLARLQAGRFTLHTQELPPEVLVDVVLESFHQQIKEKKVALHKRFAPMLPKVVADQERINIVLSNLLSNALRYSKEEASITLTITEERGAVRFAVRDEGPGIPPELQGLIFEKFTQLPGEKQGATGLGLFLAREIIKAHNGDIGVESTPGEGATLWFTLAVAGSQ